MFFFQHFGEKTKLELRQLLNDLLSGIACLDRIHYSYVALVPKNELPESVEDFRLIALQNSTLKIVSQVLANRLL